MRLDLPMIVGPLPYGDGETLELAYLEAIAAADPRHDLLTRSLVVVEGRRSSSTLAALLPHASNLMLRLRAARTSQRLAAEDTSGSRRCARRSSAGRIAELEEGPELAAHAAAVHAVNPKLLLSVHLRYGERFWEALERAVRLERGGDDPLPRRRREVVPAHPRIDAFLKARLIRARVQLVSAGGDTDTQASAATVYESVLLGANGGAMTARRRRSPWLPELIDVYHGAPADPVVASLAGTRP